jgi:hypothetical protein
MSKNPGVRPAMSALRFEALRGSLRKIIKTRAASQTMGRR